jgi:hypothetical protein
LRRIIRTAIQNGYGLGDFALGGAYVLRRELARAVIDSDVFEKSPFFAMTHVEDDVLFGMFVFYLGYAIADDVMDDGLFGVDAGHLKMSPFAIKERGNYILHSTKFGYKDEFMDIDERELVKKLMGNADQSHTHPLVGT